MRVRSDPDALFAEPGCASVVAVGQSLPFRRGGSVSLPLDVSRTLENLLDSVELDFVHVHEPFAPSAASAALRHSRALNVGSFHSTTERFVSTQVARRVVELLFGRLDGRTASFAATRDLIEPYFPGDYRVIRPGADLLHRPGDDEATGDRVLGRGGARCPAAVPARAAPLSTTLDWRATIWLATPPWRRADHASRKLRERVRLAGHRDGSRPSTWRGPRSRWRPRPGSLPRRSSSFARWPAGPCRWRRGCPSTTRCCATASWA